MNWLRLRRATQPDADEEGVSRRPQWDADYRLQQFPAMGMFEEYLEMGLYVIMSCLQSSARVNSRNNLTNVFIVELILYKSLTCTYIFKR